MNCELQYELHIPNQFAYVTTGGSGYSAHIQGEAAQLFRCTPVPVEKRPIAVNNASMYLTPRTHTIVATGRSRLWPGNSNNISALKNIWAQYLPHAESISASGILEEGTPPWGRAFVAPTADAVNYAPIIQQGTSTNEDNPPSARGLAWIHWIGLCIITPIIIIASV